MQIAITISNLHIVREIKFCEFLLFVQFAKYNTLKDFYTRNFFNT